MNKFCSSCGAPVVAGAAFCASCGAALPVAGIQPAPAVVNQILITPAATAEQERLAGRVNSKLDAADSGARKGADRLANFAADAIEAAKVAGQAAKAKLEDPEFQAEVRRRQAEAKRQREEAARRNQVILMWFFGGLFGLFLVGMVLKLAFG